MPQVGKRIRFPRTGTAKEKQQATKSKSVTVGAGLLMQSKVKAKWACPLEEGWAIKEDCPGAPEPHAAIGVCRGVSVLENWVV